MEPTEFSQYARAQLLQLVQAKKRAIFALETKIRHWDMFMSACGFVARDYADSNVDTTRYFAKLMTRSGDNVRQLRLEMNDLKKWVTDAEASLAFNATRQQLRDDEKAIALGDGLWTAS